MINQLQTMAGNDFVNFLVVTNEKTNEPELFFSKDLDPELMKTLIDITDDEHFYNDTYTVSNHYFDQYIHEINSRVQNGNFSLVPLSFYLADLHKEKMAQFEKMSADGKITFDHLTSIFKIGTEFVTTKYGELVGSVVQNTKIIPTMFGRFLSITGLFIESNGREFIHKQEEFAIFEFRGLKRPEDLNVRIMTQEDKNFLTERGKIFKKYGLGSNYVYNSGNMFRIGRNGPVYFKAEGRCIVDPSAFKIMNPNYGEQRHYFNNEKPTVCEPDLPEEILFMTSPFITGFSFVTKQWGEIIVRNLSEIKFDDNAFDLLVFDEAKKELAKALITNTGESFTDIITGKSGGCIFLLYGPPGVGKTLTCEAIAEYLKRPLYSITVGELGITPQELEGKLSQILEIAHTWNAVILIDEADVFLEKRTNNDIQRNAMVGIFLRLLERHQGVMFLTTNRANTLDEAFRSRISCVFEYRELDKETRRKIWLNLLRAANIVFDDNTVNELCECQLNGFGETKYLNGRQIKNAIRMGQSYAMNRNESITIDHIRFVINNM